MKKKFETTAIRNQAARSQNREHSAPLYLTSSFVFDSAEEMQDAFAEKIDRHVYSRYGNPNTSELIDKMCVLEKCEAGFATATGMSAIFTALAALVKQGDHILSCRSIFGASHNLFTKILPNWGVDTTYVGLYDATEWEQALRPETKIFFLETPTNPGVEIVDLKLAGEFARKHNLILAVDNCFATPYLQNPADFGADLVLHSATKYIDGQGRVLGGLILGKQELLDQIIPFARMSGPAMSPFNAWVLSKSLETLSLRVDRHCQNALTLAELLSENGEISWVRYPFLPSHPQHEIAVEQMKQGGGIVTFELKGGTARANRFMNALQVCSITSNLGDSRTIVSHPASTTHKALSEEECLAVGITEGTIRVSLGLEHIDDISEDILQALELSKVESEAINGSTIV